MCDVSWVRYTGTLLVLILICGPLVLENGSDNINRLNGFNIRASKSFFFLALLNRHNNFVSVFADCVVHPVPVSHLCAGWPKKHNRLHLVLLSVSQRKPPQPQLGPSQQQPEQLRHRLVCRLYLFIVYYSWVHVFGQ